ncbi:apicomplexan specific related [Cystoisospora suis]|uniref:Apicomplexan specific related n=1 Tax=Cystoisospora suis TaxID=483139 RepID=A0A2C6KFN9_9APIC|nr:apicomplexan specific related [Cystoisospora suis]
MFMEGPAVPLFATLVMSLQPFLMDTESRGLPSTSTFASTFYSLVAACWVLSTEDHVKVWMPALIQRLRQVQLVAQLSATEGSAYTRAMRRRKLAPQPVELQHMASANNGATNVFRLWNVDTERPPVALPGAAAQWLPPPPPFPLRSELSPEKASGSAFLPLCGPCGGFPTQGSTGRERPPALPPAEGPLLVVEPGPPERAKEPRKIVLKPFARVVRPPGRRAKSRQTQPTESACCVLSCGSPPAPWLTNTEETAAFSPTMRSTSFDQQTNWEAASHRSVQAAHRRVSAASSPFHRRDGPASKGRGEEASHSCWSPCAGGDVCTSEERSASADVLDEGGDVPPVPSSGAVVGRPPEHRLKIRYIPEGLEDVETSLPVDEEDDGTQDRLRKPSQAATVEVFLDEVRLAREQVIADEKSDGEPDVRAVLTGPNLKPLCINFKAQGAAGGREGRPPAVYLTEPDSKDLEGAKHAQDSSGLARSPRRELLSTEQLLQQQQFQLELQQLQLQQLQLQQQMHQEILRQAAPPEPVYPRYDGGQNLSPNIPCATATIRFGDLSKAGSDWQTAIGGQGDLQGDSRESAAAPHGSSHASRTEIPRKAEAGTSSARGETQKEGPSQQQTDQPEPGRGWSRAPSGSRQRSFDNLRLVKPVDIIAYPSALPPPTSLTRARRPPTPLTPLHQRPGTGGPVVCTVQVPNVLLLEAEGSRPSGDGREPWWPGCTARCEVNQEPVRMQLVPAPASIQTRAREGPVFQRQRTKSQSSSSSTAAPLPR